MSGSDRRNNAERVRVLNDTFRTSFIGGRILLTAGTAELPPDLKAQLLLKVKDFTAFDEGSDPHHEHDFGVIELEGERYFWKIDLYEDPDVKDSDGEPLVNRVLTIMLAEEY